MALVVLVVRGVRLVGLLNALAHLDPPGYSSVGVVNTPAGRATQIGSTSGLPRLRSDT